MHWEGHCINYMTWSMHLHCGTEPAVVPYIQSVGLIKENSKPRVIGLKEEKKI